MPAEPVMYSRFHVPWTAPLTALAAAVATTLAGCGEDPTSLEIFKTGAIQASVTTTGAEPDPDGYRLTVDSTMWSIAANGSLTLPKLEPGIHTVTLDDVAPNCAPIGPNPRRVSVAGGGMAMVAFSVTCVQYTGTISVTTSTTGTELDPNGYSVALDQDPGYPVSGQPIDITGALSLAKVPGGPHLITLEGVARNCTVDGSNPRAISVTPGSVSSVAFAIQCASPGSVRLLTNTSGVDIDPNGYRATIHGVRLDSTVMLPAAGAVTVATIPPGDATVTLDGVSINCEGAGSRQRTVAIPSGGTVEVTFEVACAPAPMLALVMNIDGGSEIFTIRANGAGLTRLTSHAGQDYHPAWSPDGQAIAFQSDRDGDLEIYVMNADGSRPVRITNDAGPDDTPAWSPDGNRIAFSSVRNGNSDIYVMNPDGTNRVRLTDDPGYDADPAWSPDGQKIAFLSARDGDLDVYVMNADGSGVTALTSDHQQEWSPAWSPDGRKIVFSRGCDYYCQYDLFMINADGTGLVPVTTDSACDEYDPAWSPDGRAIAFTSTRPYYGSGPCPTVLMIMRLDGSNTVELTGGSFAPAWRP